MWGRGLATQHHSDGDFDQRNLFSVFFGLFCFLACGQRPGDVCTAVGRPDDEAMVRPWFVVTGVHCGRRVVAHTEMFRHSSAIWIVATGAHCGRDLSPD